MTPRERTGAQPVDRLGRILPEPGFPAGKEGPGDLERLRRFVNTVNLESGADRLADHRGAAAWLRADGWSVGALGDDELRRLRRTRDLLRELAVANRDGRDAPAVWRALVRVGGARVRIGVRDGTPVLDGGGEVRAELVAIAVTSVLDGTWARLKACRNERCRWVVYDPTRSGSNEWCSMSACGQRHKQRQYRMRRLGTGGGR